MGRNLRTTVVSAVLVAALVMCVPVALDDARGAKWGVKASSSILRIGFLQNIDSLNPYVGLNDASWVFYGLVYDTLTCVGNDLETVPNLARSWWAVPNNTDSDPKLVGMPYGSVWQYNLSDDTFWFDGTQFTADDVIYNIWLNAEPSHYASMWAYQPYTYFMKEAWKLDNYTVRVSFWDRATQQPMPASYGYLLSIPMLPKHLLEQLPGGFPYIGMNWTGVFPEDLSPGMPIVGTGPFMATPDIFSEWVTGHYITLLRNPNSHWATDYGKQIKFDKLILKFFQDSSSMVSALKNSDIDVASYLPSAFNGIRDDVAAGTLQNVTIFDGPKINQYFTEVGFCMSDQGSHPSRLDPAIRQALHMASNKQYIVDNMYLGLAEAGSTLVPPINSYWHYEPNSSERYDFDLVAAAALLESSGYIDNDSDGWRECTASSKAVQNGWAHENEELAYDMLVRKEYPEEKDIANYLTTLWASVGVKLLPSIVEELILSQTVYSYDYDTVLWYWTSDIDPNSILFTQSRKAWSGWSDNMYSNPDFESNYNMSVMEMNPVQRKAYVDNCQRIHYLDSPYIILAYTNQTYAWRNDTFAGWGDWAADPGRSLDNYWTGNPLFFDLEPLAGAFWNAFPVLESLTVSPNPVPTNTAATFTVVASDEDADSLNFTIDFGDGNISYASGTNTTGSQTVNFVHSYESVGVYNITVWIDDSYPEAGHNISEVYVNKVLVGGPSQTFRMYDMFQEKWGEWWPWRWPGYKSDIILNNESGKYTMIFIPNSYVLEGIIYAPYRWNITATNLPQVSVNNPEFMPVLGTPNVEGAEASVDIYFQYLNWDWWNNYWKPVWNFSDDIMAMQMGDGLYPGVTYNVTMNRAAAEEWLGMPQTADPQTWWNASRAAYISNWTAWILNEGNVRLTIWPAYEYPYINLGTDMDLRELPDGRILLQIGHLGEGYEILMTRWLSETNICHHEGYYEDMSVHAEYYSSWMDFEFDAVCQYSLRAVKANESATNEPAWSWEPQLIDFLPSWYYPGWTDNSTFDPWANVTYQSWNAGDPSYTYELSYWSGVTYFNLTDYQTFVIELPKGDGILGYYAQDMPFTSISRIIAGSIPPGTSTYDKYPRGDGTNYNYTAYWPIMMNGTMSLGWYGNWTGAPDLDSCYDPFSKTITMVGPMSFDNSHHPNGTLYNGAPWIEFNVTSVTDLTPPVAVASLYPNPSDAGELVTLDGSLSYDLGGDIVGYRWTFEYGGVPQELNGKVVQFLFLTPGTYQITLTCIDEGDNTNSTTVELIVGPMIPEFHSLPLVIVSFATVFLLIRRSRRKAG